MSVFVFSFALLTASFLISGIALSITRVQNTDEPGVTFWLAGAFFLLIGSGFIVVAKSSISPEQVLTANSFLDYLRTSGSFLNGVGWLLIWRGFQIFFDKEVTHQNVFLGLIGLLGFTLASAHWFVVPQTWAVIVIAAEISALCSLILFYVVKAKVKTSLKNFILCCLIAMILCWGYRALISLISPYRDIQGTIDTVIMGLSVTATFSLCLSMIMLLNDRLIYKLARQARTDPLTGALNRRAFFEQVQPMLALAARKKQVITLAMIDVDWFKKVNDQYGHDVGDDVLISLVSLMNENFRDHDIIARFGGEEFVVCLPDTALKDAHRVMERFRSTLANNGIHTLSLAIPVTCSIGLVEVHQKLKPSELDTLLKVADTALYKAKSDGRNRIITRAFPVDEAVHV